MESRRRARGSRGNHRAAGSDADGRGLPGNGERDLTHSERKWLLKQVASQRKRPVSATRSEEAGLPRALEVVPPAPAAGDPHTDDAPSEARPVKPARRRRPPPSADSFWSFG